MSWSSLSLLSQVSSSSPFFFTFLCGQCFVINFNFVPDNLEEDSKYEARVEARNSFGWSNQSDVFKFFTRTKGIYISETKQSFEERREVYQAVIIFRNSKAAPH